MLEQSRPPLSHLRSRLLSTAPSKLLLLRRHSPLRHRLGLESLQILTTLDALQHPFVSLILLAPLFVPPSILILPKTEFEKVSKVFQKLTAVTIATSQRNYRLPTVSLDLSCLLTLCYCSALSGEIDRFFLLPCECFLIMINKLEFHL